MIEEDRVLTPHDIAELATRIRQGERLPEWMVLDLVAAGWSLIEPLEALLAADGGTLRVEVGIGSAEVLYADYWRIVWWVAALISCALITAVAEGWLIQRTLWRERRLGELKSQFVASVSHELRTPISSMRLMADALTSEQVDEESRQDFHRLMSKEGARLSALIENVLDFARIEEGRKNYSFQECDLAGIVCDTVSLMELVAAEREITIDTVIEQKPTEQTVDPHSIQQALINLLDNAIKFSPNGSSVKVTLSSQPEGWKLLVDDQGPGIPAADRERIFERFTRLGNELRREEQGTGIGLSILKHIAEAHEAEITVESRPAGGSRFLLEAPALSESTSGLSSRESVEILNAESNGRKERSQNAVAGH
jgi:signal transduction histidine kinase